GIVLAVAALPVAAVDVDEERRIVAFGMKDVVALALSGAVGPVHVGVGGEPIGGRQHRPTLGYLDILRNPLAIVVLCLVVDGCCQWLFVTSRYPLRSATAAPPRRCIGQCSSGKVKPGDVCELADAQPVLRRPAAMPLIDSRMPRLAFSSTCPALHRRMS